MAERKILLIGGGGHCRSVLDCLISENRFDTIGIIDKNNTVGIPGIPVVGTDEDLPLLLRDGWSYAFITVGSIGNTDLRRRLYILLKDTGFTLPVITDPSAAVAGYTDIAEGVFIGKNAVVNTCAKIGRCAILNTGSITEHDCHIGEFAHISPAATLCGQVSVGDDAHIGAGSVVRQGIVIGDKALIGAGSVVVSNVPAGVKAYGNPCKVVK